MTRPRLLITRLWPGPVLDYLRARFDCSIDESDRALSADALAEGMRVFDVLCPTVTDRIDAAVIGVPGRRAGLIANFGAGVDHIDLEAARRTGVAVSNTPDVLTDATADVALMLMLMTSRRAAEGARELREGRWRGWAPTHLLGEGLGGKTLGLIGCGRIGRAVAHRARVLGMRISYHARNRLVPEVEVALAAEYRESLDALVAEADIVSLHCPGSAENRHLVDDALLGRMKPSAILINTARGNIVDEAALARALSSGRLSAAGLDVFEAEPHVTGSLLDCPSAVLLPHLGSATRETRVAMGMRVADNIERFLAGHPLRDRVA
jgi:lactate dehydrogenase-like 2-hydroxyacid dehydrogenase